MRRSGDQRRRTGVEVCVKRDLRIAYVSVATPYDKASWSGTAWHTFQEVRRRFPDTQVVETPRADAVVEALTPIEALGVQVRRSPLVSWHFTRAVNAALGEMAPDLVVAVAAAHKIAYIDPKWPIVYVADALFATVASYYDRYARRRKPYHARGNIVQRSMLERVDQVLLSSDWAVAEAERTYGLPPHKLRMVPFGANLDADPGAQPLPDNGPLTLLFMGYDWERKGGPLALEIWRELRRRTGDAVLHVVGVDPDLIRPEDGLVCHGFVDKSDPAQSQRLVDLYRASSFFVMPTRQEAYGIVFCEAAAFGRPVIATATGGVPTVVLDGETGVLLPPEAGALAYADRILALWNDRDRYRRMCAAARHRYETTLNWHAWGDAMEAAVRDTVAARSA